MQNAAKCLAIIVLLLLPATARAQVITGTVRDGSGGVLPGVTVEASSPVLIEKTRTAVTDGTGQYRIIDLRAGTYELTATLPGFTTVKRALSSSSIRDEGSTSASSSNVNVETMT